MMVFYFGSNFIILTNLTYRKLMVINQNFNTYLKILKIIFYKDKNNLNYISLFLL